MAKVLVAEDDLMIADFLEEILIEAGHTVCGIARTVGEAAAMATEYRPDLGVFDICLAQGGRGTDIRARVTGGDRIGILFASGNIDAIRLTGADGDASIRKPYFGRDVVRALEIVQERLRGQPASPPIPVGVQLLA
jgi:DNA-binding response OmpR family regulator